MPETAEDRANDYIKGLEERAYDITHESLYDAGQVKVGFLAGYGLARLETQEEIKRLERDIKRMAGLLAESATISEERKREPLMDVTAHLVAAVSLLRAGGKAAKKGAPSDKMFDQMLRDYQASVDRARKILKRVE